MKGVQLLKFFVFILRSKFSKNVFVFCLRKISRVFEFPIERFERSKVSKAPSTFHGCAKKKETKLFCLKYAELTDKSNYRPISLLPVISKGHFVIIKPGDSLQHNFFKKKFALKRMLKVFLALFEFKRSSLLYLKFFSYCQDLNSAHTGHICC